MNNHQWAIQNQVQSGVNVLERAITRMPDADVVFDFHMARRHVGNIPGAASAHFIHQLDRLSIKLSDLVPDRNNLAREIGLDVRHLLLRFIYVTKNTWLSQDANVARETYNEVFGD